MDTLLSLLPVELKYEIIKHLPYYRTINKTLYKDVEKYNEFCCQPVRIQELKKNIRTFGDFNYFFTPLNNELMICKLERYENILYHIKDTVTMSRINIEDINLYITNQTYYDIATHCTILKNRFCSKPNFIQNQLIKDVNHLNPLQLYLYKKCIAREIYFEWLQKKINCIKFESIQIGAIEYKKLLIEDINRRYE